MDKMYVVIMEEHCWRWEEPCVTPIFISRWEYVCNDVVERLERECADDEVMDVHRSYYVDEVPYGYDLDWADEFVKNFVERHTR